MEQEDESKIGKRLINKQRYLAIFAAMCAYYTILGTMRFPLFRVNEATGVAVCLFVPGLGVASLVKKERKTENGKI